MALIPGKYTHYKNEDLDNYFVAVGLPYLVRKTIQMLTPVMEFKIDGEVMNLKVSSWVLTVEHTFKFGEEYTEEMPNNIQIKSVTKLISDNELLTDSVIVSNGCKTTRHYIFSEEEVVETLTHEKANGVTKRYYRREKK